MSSDPAPETVARVLSRSAPSASLVRWTVEPDSYPARTPSTDSLSRVVAETLDGATLSVFAKTIRSLRHWPMISVLPAAAREAAIARFPWRVEADAYASDLLPGLSDCLRPPVVYEVEDLGDDRIRIWMEDVPAAQVQWNEARYRQAARALGRLAGRSRWDEPPGGLALAVPRASLHLRGSVRRPRRPRDPQRGDVGAPADGRGRLGRSRPPARSDRPRRTCAGHPGRARRASEVTRPWRRVPPEFLADPKHADRFVAIDWGFVGLAPIGYYSASCWWGAWRAATWQSTSCLAIRDAVADGYLAGLRDAGAPAERGGGVARLHRRNAPPFGLHSRPAGPAARPGGRRRDGRIPAASPLRRGSCSISAT